MKIDITQVSDSTYKVTTYQNSTKQIKPEYVNNTVNIDAVSPKYLTDVALLVDKEDFLTDIKKLKEKWKITEIIEFGIPDQQLLDGWITSHLKKTFKDTDEQSARESLNRDVAEVRLKYGRTSNYDVVILWVLFTNTVPAGVYKACYFTTIPESGSNDPSRHQYAIMLDGRAENSEVIKALQDFREHLKHLHTVQQLQKLPATNHYEALLAELIIGTSIEPIQESTDRETVRTKNNVMLVRELYWRHKQMNTSFADLATYANSKCDGNHGDYSTCIYCNADEENVRKNVENYDEAINRK